MNFSGTTPNNINEWIDKKNKGDVSDYTNGKQDTQEAIDVFKSLYGETFKTAYRLFNYLCDNLKMRRIDTQSFYRAFIVLKNDDIITLRLSQHFAQKEPTEKAWKRNGRPKMEYHLIISRVQPLDPKKDLFYDRMFKKVELKIRDIDLDELNDGHFRKGVIDEIIKLLTYGTSDIRENKELFINKRHIIYPTELNLHSIVKESINNFLRGIVKEDRDAKIRRIVRESIDRFINQIGA